MRNSPTLPIVALIVALALGIGTAWSAGDSGDPLNELQLGAIALALALAVYGVQGLVSVLVEGQELHPGHTPAHLTDPLSIAIVVLSIALFAMAITLAFGIAGDWGMEAIGTLAGLGCIDLALLLVFYKEAYVGNEATFDDRDDGVPW